MNNKIHTFLFLFVSITATAQQFQPLWLIDWAPSNKMFPLTATVNGFDGVQEYAEFDTTVYGIIDTSRAYNDTWLKPEMEAGNNVEINSSNLITIDGGFRQTYISDGYFGLYGDNSNYFVEFDETAMYSGINTSNTVTSGYRGEAQIELINRNFLRGGVNETHIELSQASEKIINYPYIALKMDSLAGISTTSIPTPEGWKLGALVFGEKPSTFLRGGAITGVATSDHKKFTPRNYGTKLVFLTTENQQDTALQRLVINHNGNVGIGDTVPEYILDAPTADTIRFGNNRFVVDQILTGLDGYVWTYDENDDVSKLKSQSSEVDTFLVSTRHYVDSIFTWLKPEMESPADVTITSNNTLRFENSPGGTDFITIQADTSPEIEVDDGSSTADLLASSLTVTNTSTGQVSTQGSNQFSVNDATSATNPASSFFSDYNAGITGGETTGTEAPTIGILGFDSTSTLAPAFQFNRGTWAGGFGATERVLSGYTLGEINFLGQRSTGIATPTDNTNSYLSAKIKVETTDDYSLSTGGSTMIFETSETGTVTKREAFQIQNDQQLTANQYGSGNYTGTEAFSLAVTASGDIIEVTPSVPSNIYNTSDQLTGDRTVTTNGRFLNFNIASGGTFYITDNFNNVDNNWTESGYYHNYGDGAGTSSTMVGGLTNSDPYFQHVADDPNQTTEIKNIIDPSGGEAGFLVETNIDGVNANDVNLYVGEFSDGTSDLTGLILSNNGGVVPKLDGAYVHMRYETTDSTLRLFDNAIIFDKDQTPSTVSGETSTMEWTGDGTKADPTVIQVNHANESGTTDASGDLTVTHNLGSSTFAVSATATGTTFYNVQVHTKTSTTFKIRFFDAAGAAVASTAVTADWIAKTL